MRITYRREHVRDYWARRWDEVPADASMENKNVYPLKYSEMIIDSLDNRILEAGCGAGRILRYYKDMGYNIVGFDFIKGAIEKLKRVDPELNVEVGDITHLSFKNDSFSCVLAFGLFHSLENDLHQAIQETHRVLEPGGKICASFRADNIQTRLNDWYTDFLARKKDGTNSSVQFHKMNLTRTEFIHLIERFGFEVEMVYNVVNMPLLYKFKFFRRRDHKDFHESSARKEGYMLSWLGRIIQRILMRCFPKQFCNIYVAIAKKVEN